MDKKEFCMKRVGLTVSLACNLNCKLCGAYAPYILNRPFPQVGKLLEEVKKYFSIVDKVELFTVTGGEPLLYKQLPELLDGLLDYSNQFEKMELITNGTIVPNDDLVNVLKKYGDKFLRFYVDNYGNDLSPKVPEIIAKLNDHNLPTMVRNNNEEDKHCGGWVDFGITGEVLQPSTEKNIELFSKCAYPQKLKFCFNIRDGLMTPCPAVFRRLSLGHDVDYKEYINLNDNTLTIEQQRQKISYIYNAICFESCAYCTGLCDDSQRYTPAEQLTPEEIHQIRSLKK